MRPIPRCQLATTEPVVWKAVEKFINNVQEKMDSEDGNLKSETRQTSSKGTCHGENHIKMKLTSVILNECVCERKAMKSRDFGD